MISEGTDPRCADCYRLPGLRYAV